MNLHPVAYIEISPINIMVKEFCHLCRDGGKECVEIDESREAAMMKIQPKCAVCGRLLVQ